MKFMKQSTESITLYRLMSHESALRSIESRKFRVGRILEFNDPFEWRLGLTGIIAEGEKIAQSCMDSFLNDMNSKFGIICFSDTASDPVLWSHYADLHRGVAFEVDYLLDPEQIRSIKYSSKRPVLDVNRLKDINKLDEYLLSLFETMLYQKASSWSYEREYRVHIKLSECDTASGNYLMPIPADFLTSVILGFKCPLGEEYVRKALDDVGLKNTIVTRAKMDPESYTISF